METSITYKPNQSFLNKFRQMIEPRSAQRTRSQLSMIQSKKTDWIIRPLCGNTPEAIGHCPEGAEGFGFGVLLAKSNNSPLCGLRGLCGERSSGFLLLQPNLVLRLSFRRSKGESNQQLFCGLVSNLENNEIKPVPNGIRMELRHGHEEKNPLVRTHFCRK